MVEIISREEAREKGLKRYFTGVPCKPKGHICERRVNNGACVICLYEKKKDRLTRDPEFKARNNAACLAHMKSRKDRDPNFREKRRTYYNQRLKKDLNFKLAHGLRVRMNAAIKFGSKSGSAVEDLGCSIAELQRYLQGLFQDGMTWENYGEVWEIDHVIPLSRFDLADRAQFLEACNYRNLQPLTVNENRSKKAQLNFKKLQINASLSAS